MEKLAKILFAVCAVFLIWGILYVTVIK